MEIRKSKEEVKDKFPGRSQLMKRETLKEEDWLSHRGACASEGDH